MIFPVKGESGSLQKPVGKKKKGVNWTLRVLKMMRLSRLPAFGMKTRFCAHENGCVVNVLESTRKAFVFTYILRVGFKLVLGIPRYLRNPLKIIRLITNPYYFKYAAFPAILVFFFKSLLCLLRHKTKSDSRKNVFLAGFISGFLGLF